MNLKPEQMSREALLRRCNEQEDELRRLRFQLDQSSTRNYSLQHQLGTKTVKVPRKRKGELDDVSRRYIWAEFRNQVYANLVSQPMTLMAMYAAGEFSWIAAGSGLINAIFGPAKMYFQKKGEVH